MKKDNKFCYIEILRALACMLITNSHFDGVYPIDISFGGAPGNCLFFVLTGFLLTADYEKKRFVSWYPKRIIRLYVPLTIMNIVNVLVGYRKPSIELFLFPVSRYWFIPVIVILYAMFFVIMKYFRPYRLYVVLLDLAIYFIVYFVCFDRKVFFVERHFYFLVMYGIIAMILGSYIRENLHHITEYSICKSIILLLSSLLCIIGFLGIKLWISTESNLALQLQFLTQLFSLGFCTFILLGTSSHENVCRKVLESVPVGSVIQNIGGATLEIYLVQYVIINSFKERLIFPLNLVIICVLIYCGGIILKFVSSALVSKVQEKL